jgi:two-component system, chemotaxis family, sensor kinase CheA
VIDPVFDIFREEAREHLGALERGFLDLEALAEAGPRRAAIDSLFRHAHSLKGDARAVGLPDLQQAAQTLEDILDNLRENPDRVNQAVIDQGLAQLDVVRQAFDRWHQEVKGGEGGAATPDVPVPASPAAEVLSPVGRSASPTLSDETFTVRVPSERLDRMLSLAGELRIAHRAQSDLVARLADLGEYLADGLDSTRRFERLCQSRDPESQAAARSEAAGVRQRLEGCLDQMQRLGNDLQKKQLRDGLLLEALETDIQQARLLPLVMLADSLRRAVRDLGQSLGKAIRYEVDVGDILLDKAVMEAVRDPLLHLLRNAAAHGLETPDERRAVSKPEEGLIRLAAGRRGPAVRITISDDGRGVDYERVRERLRQIEGLGEAEVHALTEEQLGRYLFKPGFTTTRARDTLSGRGVGLDVVLDTARRLQGTAELVSTSRAGTTFSLSVPVSISTVRVLTVLSQGQYYGVPTTLIDRTGRVRYRDLRELDGHPVLTVDGEPIRWAPLSDLTGAVASRTPEEGQWCPFLLIRQGRRRCAVAVDELEDESEVLLKPLGFPLRDLPGVLGATIRPDGAVQIVLDLSNTTFGPTVSRKVLKQPATRAPGRILVVDDSPTTRTILRNVFTSAGYSVRTASDGVEALDRLRTQSVDLVVSDLEMPRMDGFELTRQIKARLRLPVILVTGLEKEEHRRKGLEVGADAYVVKSTFQGEGLLEVVRQLIY